MRTMLVALESDGREHDESVLSDASKASAIDEQGWRRVPQMR